MAKCRLPYAGYKILNNELMKMDIKTTNKQVFHDDKGYFLKLEIIS